MYINRKLFKCLYTLCIVFNHHSCKSGLILGMHECCIRNWKRGKWKCWFLLFFFFPCAFLLYSTDNGNNSASWLMEVICSFQLIFFERFSCIISQTTLIERWLKISLEYLKMLCARVHMSKHVIFLFFLPVKHDDVCHCVRGLVCHFFVSGVCKLGHGSHTVFFLPRNSYKTFIKFKLRVLF